MCRAWQKAKNELTHSQTHTHTHTDAGLTHTRTLA